MERQEHDVPQTLLDELRKQPATITELVTRAGFCRPTVIKHLNRLAEQSRVSSIKVHERGGTGAPAKQYFITDANYRSVTASTPEQRARALAEQAFQLVQPSSRALHIVLELIQTEIGR